MTQQTRTVERPNRVDAPTSAALLLTVETGVDAGASLLVSAAQPMRVHVGTSAICELRLSDRLISRRHAAVEREGDDFRIHDLGSTNGTLLDGVPIIAAILRPGDTIRIGDTVLRVSLGEGPGIPTWSALRFGKVVGASDAMRRLYPLCERLARVNVPTLIEGERGTGKEVLAESLHDAGGRTGAFLVMDCAGSPESLARELFGEGDQPGLVERATGGTLLLDEVGDLPLPLQRDLGRVLDRGEVRRGATTIARRVDVRVIAASRRDLERLVQTHRFEEQLLVRLAATRIELPPLRARHGDPALLARHFTEEMEVAPLDASTLATLDDYGWPGNVTELKSAVLRYIAIGELDTRASRPRAGKSELPESGIQGDWLDRLVDGGTPFSIAKRNAVEEFERRYIERLLEKNAGNVSRAAAASGIALRSFQRVKSRRRAQRPLPGDD